MKNYRMLLTFATVAAFTAAGSAQTVHRRAILVPADYPSEGRCTVSALVYGDAQVEIRGDSATLRNVAGPAPEWHRFECTGPLPNSPSNLRIRAVEGTGRMTLSYDSDVGGAAVVRIENPEIAGGQIYTFDIFWRPERVYQSNDADRAVLDDDSIQACRTATENRIRNDGYRNVHFGSVSKDDRGANDTVTGTVSASNSNGSNAFTFSCRVNPSDGQIRQLDVVRR